MAHSVTTGMYSDVVDIGDQALVMLPWALLSTTHVTPVPTHLTEQVHRTPPAVWPYLSRLHDLDSQLLTLFD